MTVTQREYTRLRRKGWPAKDAWRSAKIRERWHKAWRENKVRIVLRPDDCTSFEDWSGDTYDERANPDIQRSRMDRERKEAMEHFEREGGCVGIIGQYALDDEAQEDDPHDSPHWETAESCWGFLADDTKDNGYDDDIKNATLDALEAQAIA